MQDAADLPRTLTQMLREWDDEDLRTLLTARPDLAFPMPSDFSQVASRATTRHSIESALDELTTAEVWVARSACQVASPFVGDDLAEQLAATAAAGGAHSSDAESVIRSSIERLWSLCLLWGGWSSLRPVRAMSALLDQPDATTPQLIPPRFDDLPTQKPGTVDKVAAASAFEFVRRMDVLVEHLDHHPARLTRAGSITSRDLRALAELLDAPAALTQAYLEVALADGLIGLSAREPSEVLIPTARFDSWQGRPLAEQWEQLVGTWLDHHPPSGLPNLKALCLQLYGDPAGGRVVTAADLKAYLSWHRPRRPTNADKRAAAFVEQAASMGVTGLGALASFAWPPSAKGLDQYLPARVEHVLIQADLTAIAPGPLTARAAADLGTLADVESRGGATVYRFSPTSLARAHALGWTVDDILETLAVRSRTPVPQPLEYQVRELDRRRRPGPTFPSAGNRLGDPLRHRPPERARPAVDSDAMTPQDRLDEATLDAVLASLRHEADDHDEPSTDPGSVAEHFWAAPVDTLREAVETQELVWLGYVDGQGASRERVVHVVRVDEGEVTAKDTEGTVLTLPVRRISAAHIIRSKR
jgi:hypothetical protein